MTTINIGIVGYGMSTTVFHIPTIANTPDAKVRAVVQRAPAPSPDAKPSRGQHVTIDFPDVKHYQDASSMLKDPKIHLAIIATPSPGHYELAREALENGKHGQSPVTSASLVSRITNSH